VLVIRRACRGGLGVLAALATGLAIGAWQGFWVAYVGIPAFIVTLAGMLLFRGLTLQVLDNISLSPFPASTAGSPAASSTACSAATATTRSPCSSGRSRSPGTRRQLADPRGQAALRQPVESVPLFALQILLVGSVVMAFAYQLSRSRGLPYVLIILAALILAYATITRSSVFGRRSTPIGGNLSAARCPGSRSRRSTSGSSSTWASWPAWPA
jgi:putative multiple sugar transport system permease protein